MLAKKTSKNQLTLPKAVVDALPDAEYFDVTVKGGKITLVPVKMAPVSATLEGIRENKEIKKIVLDTNILISALLFKGELSKIVDLWEKGKIIPVISKETFEE